MRIKTYDEIMDQAIPALDLAAMIGESPTAWSRNTWRKRLRTLGEYRFRLELYYFLSELLTGERPRNLGATLTARLDAVIANALEGRS